MLRKLEESKSWVRAYADDIVIAVKDRKDIDLKLKIVLDWCKNYEINLNPEKSGIIIQSELNIDKKYKFKI